MQVFIAAVTPMSKRGTKDSKAHREEPRGGEAQRLSSGLLGFSRRMALRRPRAAGVWYRQTAARQGGVGRARGLRRQPGETDMETQTLAGSPSGPGGTATAPRYCNRAGPDGSSS